MDISQIVDRIAVIDVLIRYATACDRRDWRLFDDIFLPDVKTDYGNGLYTFNNRQDVVNLIRSFLGGCGPTQHLLGNYRIDLEGDMANSVCSVRAFHVGISDAAGLTYEMAGEYRDHLKRTKDGWRIARRALVVNWEQGSRKVLRPG